VKRWGNKAESVASKDRMVIDVMIPFHVHPVLAGVLWRGREADLGPLGAKSEDPLREAVEEGLVDVRLLVAVRDFLDAPSPGR
jgi:hypothetical protein